MLILGALAHSILAWRLLGQRPVAMFVLGVILVCAALMTLISHVFSKRLGKKWLIIHRIATLVILIVLVIHICLGIISI